MSIKMLLPVFLVLLATPDFSPVKERVQNNADFTYNSHVKGTPDNKLQIECSIENNSDTNLATQWDDCGILAKGFAHLKPGEQQSKSFIAYEPYLFDHSNINYGTALQYVHPARCYVDGQARSKTRAQTRVSEYERTNHDGAKLFRIEVASTLSEGGRTANLNLRVVGGLSLILPSRIGTEISSLNEANGEGGWEIKKNTLIQMALKDESDREVISGWLNKTPPAKKLGGGSDLVVLKNNIRESNEISFPVTGVNWGLEKVYLIAFMPNMPGAFGLTADVYLPR